MTIANEPLSSVNIDAAHAVLSQLRTGLTIDSLSKFIGHPDYRFLVFRSHGGVVAVCGYRLLVTITRGKHCHLHDLAVDKVVRGQGIGRAVIAELSSIVARAGAQWIFLDGIDSALGFYDKIGFQRHPATLLKLSIDAEQGAQPDAFGAG